MEARIIAVADVVEAMCSHRPYRPALDVSVSPRMKSGASGAGPTIPTWPVSFIIISMKFGNH